MSRKKYVMVLDVEGMSNKRPYNVGYLVTDLSGNVACERSFALMDCIMENLDTAIRRVEKGVAEQMTHNNIIEILNDPIKYKWLLSSDFVDTLKKDLTDFGISEIWAYNCNFDKNQISKLVNLDVEWCDIWTAIVKAKCLTKKFVRFCKENQFLTEKGNCKTSAEVVYNYLTNQTQFVEEHTGLADVKIEYEIFMNVRKQKKKIHKEPTQAWRLVQNFVQENGL